MGDFYKAIIIMVRVPMVICGLYAAFANMLLILEDVMNNS